MAVEETARMLLPHFLDANQLDDVDPDGPDHRFSTWMPLLPARIASVARPRNRPCSTTPSVPLSSAARLAGSNRSGGLTSTIRLPLSVRSGSPLLSKIGRAHV